MISDVRRFSALVGRRTALRCAALGLVAVTLEACGARPKNNNGTGNGNQDSSGGPGTPAATGRTTGAVATAMLEAFVKGQWRVTANGGIVKKPKTSIGPNGFIALVQDTEGNVIGLHSIK